jgi:hypothetical protein
MLPSSAPATIVGRQRYVAAFPPLAPDDVIGLTRYLR